MVALASTVGASTMPIPVAAQEQQLLNGIRLVPAGVVDVEHDLGAQVVVIGADGIDEAYDRVVAGDVRSQFVAELLQLMRTHIPPGQARPHRTAIVVKAVARPDMEDSLPATPVCPSQP